MMSHNSESASTRWLPAALAAFAGFGLTNFILGMIAERVGSALPQILRTIELLAMAMGAVGLAALIGWRKSPRLNFFRDRPRLLLFPIVAGISLIVGMTVLKKGLAADPLSKGPIVALTAANALIVAILARLILQEKLSPVHLRGFLLVLAGILVIAASYPSRATFQGILFGFGAMIGFGVTNFLLKITAHQKADPVGTVVILWLSGGSVGLAIFAMRTIRFFPTPASFYSWITVGALLAGLTLAGGMLFLKKALVHGPAGPVTAVTGSNAVLVALLDLLILGHTPPPLKVLGMVAVLAGILFLALSSLERPGCKWAQYR